MRAGLALAATTLVASPAFAANTLTDLEGDDRGGATRLDDPLDQRAVSAMDAVEIADRRDRAGQ